MLRNWLALLLAFVLLSSNLLSLDFDGEAFEGKGIETAVLYFPSAAQKEAREMQSHSTSPTLKDASLEEGTQVVAFEVPSTLLSKFFVPLTFSLTAPLPVRFMLSAPVLSEPLFCATTPRGPPPKPILFRSYSLRAPPVFPLT